MDEKELLAERFEENRSRLRSVAYRMLGSLSEADDALQESWLRVSRADASAVDNLNGWLTTVVARVCLDMLRSRRSRRESSLEVVVVPESADPEQEVVMADSLGLALLLVLETLAPAERLAFVLHDMFAMPFDEIAPIVGRTPAAARQLASRARRRVQVAAAEPDVDLKRNRAVVDAFLAASRSGDFEGLIALLDPNAVIRADPAAVKMGSDAVVHGARGVADFFSGRARAARPALVDGAAGATWLVGGKPRVVFAFTIRDGKIAAIDLLADPERLRRLSLQILGDS